MSWASATAPPRGPPAFATTACSSASITSALIDSPVMIDLAVSDKIESYTLPQGVLSQMMRDMAAGRPGLITRTGLHTFVDPRHGGARQSKSATEDLVELMEIDGQEYLRFKPFPIDVAILRGTTADEDGNVSMEQEAIFGEMLSCAQATRRNGGIVIVQVKRMAQRGTLPAKTVKIPGILVDYVVVDPDQRQTYATDYSPAYAGEFRVPLHDAEAPAVRRAQDRRAPGGHGDHARRDLQSRRRYFDGHIGGRDRGERSSIAWC